MKQFFLTVLGVFTGLILFVVVVPVVLLTVAIAGASKPTTPATMVLELDLREGISDQPSTNPFAAFGGSSLSVTQVVDGLAQAQEDAGVKAVLVRLPESGMTPASADELRQAIRRFRASGKPVIAHSQGFAPAGAVMSTYMVGASASELWMQNTAGFQATGFSADSLFLGRAFDKYGVRADFEQRYEYKNAVNEYTQSDYTPAHREAMTAWMTSLYDSALANAAQDRKTTSAALKTVIEAGPYSAEQALANKLIDKIGQVEEAEAEIKRRAGKGAEIVGRVEPLPAVVQTILVLVGCRRLVVDVHVELQSLLDIDNPGGEWSDRDGAVVDPADPAVWGKSGAGAVDRCSWSALCVSWHVPGNASWRSASEEEITGPVADCPVADSPQRDPYPPASEERQTTERKCPSGGSAGHFRRDRHNTPVGWYIRYNYPAWRQSKTWISFDFARKGA